MIITDRSQDFIQIDDFDSYNGSARIEYKKLNLQIETETQTDLIEQVKTPNTEDIRSKSMKQLVSHMQLFSSIKFEDIQFKKKTHGEKKLDKKVELEVLKV